MQILNVGIWEIFFVLLIMLIVLGPDNMMKSARELGRFISRVTKSPMWATMLSTSREIRELPTRIVREAGMEETLKEIEQESGVLTQEVKGEIALAMDQVDTVDQEFQTVTDDIARKSAPVAFSMKNDEPGDSEPKEAEEISNPLETDPEEEIEEMMEDAAEDAAPDPGERSIVPPGIIEVGEEASITDDFVRPAVEDTESEPASEAESSGDADEDGRDFGIPPAIIEPDPESFEDAIIEPSVEISKPKPLQDELIEDRPMTKIPARKPGADLPDDTPPPPVDFPKQASEEDSEDQDTEKPAE
jgi:Sec-independent protein translocase protein TatA